MVRTVIGLLVGIFVLAVIRLIVSTMGKMFTEATASSGSSTQSVPKGGELKKCAVCGTYSPTALAPRVKGAEVFVCSDACAQKYRA